MTEINFFTETRKARGTAVECTREHFDYCLNVLPPVYAPGCFGVGEPYSHEVVDGRTVTTHHWCSERGGKFLCAFGTKAEAMAIFG